MGAWLASSLAGLCGNASRRSHCWIFCPACGRRNLSEVRRVIEARRLYNLGIGLTDAELIASVLINPSTLLWTKDKRFRKAAASPGICARPRESLSKQSENIPSWGLYVSASYLGASTQRVGPRADP